MEPKAPFLNHHTTSPAAAQRREGPTLLGKGRVGKGRTNTSPEERGMEGCRDLHQEDTGKYIGKSIPGGKQITHKDLQRQNNVAVALGSYTWGART